ncbi:hypothetical protein RQP46_003717 [Phenoliferia psychrophenolica]
MLGRVFHYAADVVLVSAVLAGVKHSSGFQVTTAGIPEGPARQTADTVLGIGEKIFDYTAALSYTSSYFERASPSSSPGRQ